MKILGVCGAQGALLYKFRHSHLYANIEPRGIFHTNSEKQWNLNFEGIPFTRTFEQLSTDLQEVRPDLIIGSPSCGHSSRFSYSRKKSLGEPQDDESMKFYISMIDKLRPRGFIMENLPKMIDLMPLSEWEKILPDYEIIVHCHSVSRFGNSQVTRKRLLMIGLHKTDQGILNSVDFTDIFSVRPNLKTCEQLEKQIRPKQNHHEEGSRKVSMYYYSDPERKSLSLDAIEKLWNGEFKEHYRWPMFGHKMKSLPGVYRNRYDKPPLTLRPAIRQFTPEGKVMGLEWYRVIMGFPKSFQIFIHPESKDYWYNKARITYTKGATFEMGTWLFRLLRKYKAL